MEDAPILSYYLKDESSSLPPPATSSQECRVGPDPAELVDGGPCWAHRPNKQTKERRQAGKKRRRQPTTLERTIVNEVKEEEEDDDNDDYDDNDYNDSTFSKAIRTFLSSGCCVFPDCVLPSRFVKDCHTRARNDLDFLQSELLVRKKQALEVGHRNHHLLASVQRVDFAEMVARDGGRCDVRFRLDRFPFTAPGLVYNPIVFPLVQELLGGGHVNLLYAGVMWADTRTNDAVESQKWHADGGHLFRHAHQPPHCINVFYPLVDLTADNGPTEFKPGSHRLGRLNDATLAEIPLCCKAGGAILFDYRIKHRGGANRSDIPRPVLYLAYSKPFFRDAGNLRSGKSLVVSSQDSPPWVARILDGAAMPVGKGFNNCGGGGGASSGTAAVSTAGSGERWVLFQMTVQIGEADDDNSAVIVVHNGDVAEEVAAQFCLAHSLGDDFVPVLAETIQTQIDASMAALGSSMN